MVSDITKLNFKKYVKCILNNECISKDVMLYLLHVPQPQTLSHMASKCSVACQIPALIFNGKII